jgi:hypothetical protein
MRRLSVALCLMSVSCSIDPGTNSERTVVPLNRTPGQVVATDYGDKWPFTVPSGRLSCAADGPRKYVTFFDDKGVEYSLNGTAKGTGRWPSSDAIRKRHQPENLRIVEKLPELQRMAVFANTVACEDGANEATCKAKVRREYSISTSDAEAISNEGVEKGWAPLTPRLEGDVMPLIAKGLEFCN